MMAIAPEARATDDYGAIGQRSDFESLSELSKISSDKNFGRYRHNATIVDALFVENPVFAHALHNYQANYVIAEKTIRSLTPSVMIQGVCKLCGEESTRKAVRLS